MMPIIAMLIDWACKQIHIQFFYFCSASTILLVQFSWELRLVKELQQIGLTSSSSLSTEQ